MPGIFVVGCSRSGTSVLQKFLVNGLMVWSLPETEFFLKKHTDFRDKLLRIKGLLDKSDVKWRAGGDVGEDVALLTFSVEFFDRTSLCNYLVEGNKYNFLPSALDFLAKEKGYEWWVEKTPTHYQHMLNSLSARDVEFVVYVIRDGVDVAASIRDRALKNAPIFDNQLSIDYSINLWNDSLKECLKLDNEYGERLIVVGYTEFVENKDLVLNTIQEKTGIKERVGVVGKELRIAGSNEVWKSGIKRSLSLADSKKEIFSEEELQYLRGNPRYDLYEKIKNLKSFVHGCNYK